MTRGRRAIGAISRRVGRPELLATFYAADRQAMREEIGIAAILAACLRSDSTFVDIGANRGQVLREAVRLAPRGQHLAFEPIPGLAAALAGAFPQVECRQKALGARAETATFCHFRNLDGWSGLRRSLQVSDERGDPEYIEVAVSTLDAEIADLRPSVVKIDVEGAELDVIEGARGLLSEMGPVVIFEHVAQGAALYGTASEAIWDAFDELGYRIASVTGEGPFTRSAFAESTAVVNWVASSERHR